MQKYTDIEKTELVKKICAAIIQDSVAKACQEYGIAQSTFFLWLASDEELSEHYARTREAISYKDETIIEGIATKVLNAEMDPQSARVAIDAHKWLAGKRNPKVYGDKTDVTTNGKEVRGVTIVVAKAEDKDLLESI